MRYHQCKLIRKKKSPDGVSSIAISVVWIPERYAKKNKYLKIKLSDGTWENGWLVSEIFEGNDEKDVLANEREWLYQRDVSDV